MIKVLDDQHGLLFDIIRRFRKSVYEGNRAFIIDNIECLLSYAVMHFATEDRLMIESGYPGFAAHQKEHEAALEMITFLESSYCNGEPNAAEELVRFIEFWAHDHISRADHELETYLSSIKWQDHTSSDSRLACA